MTERQNIPFAMMPIPVLAEDVESLIDTFKQNSATIPSEAECNNCSTLMHLQEVMYECQKPPFKFIIDGIPGYQCYTCNLTRLPAVLEDVVDKYLHKEIDNYHL